MVTDHKAIAIATSGQPGPVHIDVPIGVAEGISDELPVPVAKAMSGGRPGVADLTAALSVLAVAQRPIAIAGVGGVLLGLALLRFSPLKQMIHLPEAAHLPPPAAEPGGPTELAA